MIILRLRLFLCVLKKSLLVPVKIFFTLFRSERETDKVIFEPVAPHFEPTDVVQGHFRPEIQRGVKKHFCVQQRF